MFFRKKREVDKLIDKYPNTPSLFIEYKNRLYFNHQRYYRYLVTYLKIYENEKDLSDDQIINKMIQNLETYSRLEGTIKRGIKNAMIILEEYDKQY